MIDKVTASIAVDPGRFTPDALAATGVPWHLKRTVNAATGEVGQMVSTHSPGRANPETPGPIFVTVDHRRGRVRVEVTLPRQVSDGNWRALAVSDVPVACARVDAQLRRCFGALAAEFPGFADWPVRTAEYPHDVQLGSREAVERLLRALDGQRIPRVHKNGGIPIPYKGERGTQTGLTWQGSARKTTVYDKATQCRDPRCPDDLLRIETRVETAKEWRRLQTPEDHAAGARMTVAEAGTVRVAALVLERTYDDLGLGRDLADGVADPFPILAACYGQQRARTLAGFHDRRTLHGDRAARAAYGAAMYGRHMRDLAEAGIALGLSDAAGTPGARGPLPPIPRPDAAFLARRTPIVAPRAGEGDMWMALVPEVGLVGPASR